MFDEEVDYTNDNVILLVKPKLFFDISHEDGATDRPDMFRSYDYCRVMNGSNEQVSSIIEIEWIEPFFGYNDECCKYLLHECRGYHWENHEWLRLTNLFPVDAPPTGVANGSYQDTHDMTGRPWPPREWLSVQ